jgi:hypothetical protein
MGRDLFLFPTRRKMDKEQVEEEGLASRRWSHRIGQFF